MSLHFSLLWQVQNLVTFHFFFPGFQVCRDISKSFWELKIRTWTQYWLLVFWSSYILPLVKLQLTFNCVNSIQEDAGKFIHSLGVRLLLWTKQHSHRSFQRSSFHQDNINPYVSYFQKGSIYSFFFTALKESSRKNVTPNLTNQEVHFHKKWGGGSLRGSHPSRCCQWTRAFPNSF